MKKIIPILAIMLFFSCHGNNQKEKEILEKNQSAASDSSKNNTAFRIDTAIVRKAFLAFLPQVSGNRDLNRFTILLGDINADGITDAVVDYSLEPTVEDNGGGGNAISEIPGVIAFINTGKSLEL